MGVQGTECCGEQGGVDTRGKLQKPLTKALRVLSNVIRSRRPCGVNECNQR